MRTSGAVRFSGFFAVEPALVPAVPDLVPDAFELSTQWPVNWKHTGSFLPAAWLAGAVSPVAGAVPGLALLEAGADEAGAAEEAGAEEDCAVAGASWAWTAGMAARIAAATAAVTRLAVRSLARARAAAVCCIDLGRPGAKMTCRRPKGAELQKSERLPIDLFGRLTFHLP